MSSIYALFPGVAAVLFMYLPDLMKLTDISGMSELDRHINLALLVPGAMVALALIPLRRRTLVVRAVAGALLFVFLGYFVIVAIDFLFFSRDVGEAILTGMGFWPYACLPALVVFLLAHGIHWLVQWLVGRLRSRTSRMRT